MAVHLYSPRHESKRTFSSVSSLCGLCGRPKPNLMTKRNDRTMEIINTNLFSTYWQNSSNRSNEFLCCCCSAEQFENNKVLFEVPRKTEKKFCAEQSPKRQALQSTLRTESRNKVDRFEFNWILEINCISRCDENGAQFSFKPAIAMARCTKQMKLLNWNWTPSTGHWICSIA